MKRYAISLVGLLVCGITYSEVKVWKVLTQSERRMLVAKTLPNLTDYALKNVVEEYNRNVDETNIQQLKACQPLVYGTNTGIGFYVINESNKPMWVGVVNGSMVMTKRRKVAPQENVNRFIDLAKSSRILIWTKDPGELKYESVSPVQVMPMPDFEFDMSSLGKTIYLKWNGTDIIPDAGKPGCKMSTLGLALDKNVDAADLKRVENKKSDAGTSKKN